MTSLTDARQDPLASGRSRSRSTGSGRAIRWLRANLFPSIPSSIISLLLIFLLAKACVSFVQWGFWNAIWTVPDNQTNACRAIALTSQTSAISSCATPTWASPRTPCIRMALFCYSMDSRSRELRRLRLIAWRRKIRLVCWALNNEGKETEW